MLCAAILHVLHMCSFFGGGRGTLRPVNVVSLHYLCNGAIVLSGLVIHVIVTALLHDSLELCIRLQMAA